MKLWLPGGVSIQRDDGTVETGPLDEARADLDTMPPEKHALYEDIGARED